VHSQELPTTLALARAAAQRPAVQVHDAPQQPTPDGLEHMVSLRTHSTVHANTYPSMTSPALRWQESQRGCHRPCRSGIVQQRAQTPPESGGQNPQQRSVLGRAETRAGHRLQRVLQRIAWRRPGRRATPDAEPGQGWPQTQLQQMRAAYPAVAGLAESRMETGEPRQRGLFPATQCTCERIGCAGQAAPL
jgi:hypothetical protein